jgi:hypothetical protein
VAAVAGIMLAGALALTGCGASDSGSAQRSTAEGKAQQNAATGAVGSGAADRPGTTGQKDTVQKGGAPGATAEQIVRTASLTVQVKNVPKALDEARTATEDAGGFVGEENTSRDDQGHESTRVVLRVPSEAYDKVLTDLQGSGELIRRTAQAEDVTDQVVDVNSRIASQRASVSRIRDLMNRADQLSDVVTLEGELSSREADLEALLAEQASLKDRTSLATITLTLSETPAKKAAKDDGPGFLDALAGGWHVFVVVLRWIVLALGAVLPFAAAAALLVLVWLRVVRRWLPRRAATAPVPAVPGPVPGAAGPLPTGTGPYPAAPSVTGYGGAGRNSGDEG